MASREPLLHPKKLEHFFYEGFVEMPVIMEADIEDRSKGNALSKGIAVLQLTWFVFSLYLQNPPITLLGLGTLAVAALTGIAYAFWWKEPKNAGRSVGA